MAQYGDSMIYLGGDVIVEINGVPIRGYADYFSTLFGTERGDEIEVTVFRSGRRIVLKTNLVEQNEESMRWVIR